jgi:hypothetical protein
MFGASQEPHEYGVSFLRSINITLTKDVKGFDIPTKILIDKVPGFNSLHVNTRFS